MRAILILLPLCVILGACRAAPPPRPETPPPAPVMGLDEAAEAMANGSPEGFARLAAAGPDAVPYLTPMLESQDRQLRMKALRLLVDSGEDIELSTVERVDLLLAEVVRPESPPYSSLRALAELEEMGPAADAALETAAEREDEEGAAARGLLLLRAR